MCALTYGRDDPPAPRKRARTGNAAAAPRPTRSDPEDEEEVSERGSEQSSDMGSTIIVADGAVTAAGAEDITDAEDASGVSLRRGRRMKKASYWMKRSLNQVL